jgi:hypothetical protein
MNDESVIGFFTPRRDLPKAIGLFAFISMQCDGDGDGEW